MMHKYCVYLTHIVEVKVDDSLMPDAEFRKSFGDYHTLEDMAGYIAWNTIKFPHNSFIEGIGDASEGKFKVLYSELQIDEIDEV